MWYGDFGIVTIKLQAANVNSTMASHTIGKKNAEITN